MPNKDEGDDKKSTKDVVNKKQKQILNQEDYLPEEGYDVARDEGKVKSSKDKKDATTLPVSDEVKKTQKKSKGKSAFEIVKAKYGKAVMDTKKEELDLTKVAEAFGGYIVEKKEPPIESGSFDMSDSQKKFRKNEAGKKKVMRSIKTTKTEPVRISDKNFEDLKDMVSGKKSADDLDATRKGTKVTGDITGVAPDPISKPDLRKAPTKRIDLRTRKRKTSRKATPKELERTRAQVAAIDTKEKGKTMQSPSGKGRIQIPRGEGQIRTFKGFKQRTQRSVVKTGKQVQKAVAPVATPVAKFAKASPLGATIAGIEVAKITPGLKRFFTVKPPLPPKVKGGKVGRRTAG